MIDYAQGKASPGLQRLQAIEKDIADRFFRWCEHHGLISFLVCGSALGAVRHGDIIPWDDDIDIGMLRADFERMFVLFSADPIPGTYLQSHRGEPRYPYPFAKLRVDGTSVVEPGYTGTKAHSGIFIDLFPFDNLPNAASLRSLQHVALGTLNLFIMPHSRETLSATRSVALRLAKQIIGWLHPVLPMRPLIALREWFAQLPRANKSATLDSFGMYGIRFGPETSVDIDLLIPPTRAGFGAINAWVPRDCERYLTSLFGNFRQLPPEDQRRPGHVTTVDFGALGD